MYVRCDLPFLWMAHPLLIQGTNGKRYLDPFKQILATGKIKPVPFLIQPNGLAGVKDGLQYMQDGKVSPTHVQFRYRSIGMDSNCKLAG
jgi:hypothetical protein